jgi:uncharacterized membrane protein
MRTLFLAGIVIFVSGAAAAWYFGLGQEVKTFAGKYFLIGVSLAFVGLGVYPVRRRIDLLGHIP